jgi:diacylglycerol kinase family enzyme
MVSTRRSRTLVKRGVALGLRQRVAAIAAILFDFAAMVLLVIVVLARPLHALLVLVIAVLFLASVFTTVLSAGIRRKLGFVGVVAFGVALAISILFWSPEPGEPGWQGPLVIVLFLAGAGLTRYALWVPPPSGFELFTVQGERTTKHPVLLMNLRSGGGKAEEFDLRGICLGLGIEPIVLEEGADLAELARDAVGRGADALGMAGGDGSLAVVATVAVEHDLPFVCVPAGTRNHFALDAGLDRSDPRQALASFINGEERRIDYATVNGRMFLNNVSLGVYAAIVEQDSYRDAKLETALTLLPELWETGGPWFDLQFDVPDHGRLERAAILQVSNSPYGKELGRRDRLDTGELGIITADPARLGDLVGLTMLAAAGQPDRASALWIWSAPSLHLDSGQSSLSIGIDGETVTVDTPLDFASVHCGLRLLVPAGSRVGLVEQHLGLKGTYQALLEVAFGIGGPDT